MSEEKQVDKGRQGCRISISPNKNLRELEIFVNADLAERSYFSLKHSPIEFVAGTAAERLEEREPMSEYVQQDCPRDVSSFAQIFLV